jgi:mannose-6-phosphate isomerase-like protein (cupin superfamily)
MHKHVARPICVLAIAVLASSALLAQSTTTGPPAPKDRAMDMPAEMFQAVAREITAKGQITQRVLEGGTFSVNVRHNAGAETGLQHGRIAEVWVVRDGTGVVATGGTLVDRKPGAGPGDFSGSRIDGGIERTIKPGDLVYIPPGVPHGIKESKTGITYLNIRFEIQ